MKKINWKSKTKLVAHHFNSRRFRCPCGKTRTWSGSTYVCSCGIKHVRVQNLKKAA